jgi:hypothetical protein
VSGMLRPENFFCTLETPLPPQRSTDAIHLRIDEIETDILHAN